MRIRFPVIVLSVLLAGSVGRCDTQENAYNVLFICVDDLRPELGCYGQKHMITPSIDQLAQKGMAFRQHYVMFPSCGASRYAMLTGRRSSVSGARSHGSMHSGSAALDHKHLLAGAQSLPELFHRSGYATAAFGKISHNASGTTNDKEKRGQRAEVPHAWDEMPSRYGSLSEYEQTREKNDKPTVEFVAEKDTDLPDGRIAEACVAKINEYADTKQRFFVAVGFLKPHLPFVAPKKYRQMYDAIDVPPAENPNRGETHYWHPSDEFFTHYTTTYNRPLSEETKESLRKAYMACVTYTDTQIGKVMQALKDTGLDQNTIVVLWGDHGWLLGDHAVWGKHTVLEKGVNSPLIISVPGMTHAGAMTDAIVESVDIYPTLMELCNPSFKKTQFDLDGYSLIDVIKDPTHPGKEAAICYYKSHVDGYKESLGLRTDRYRLTASVAKKGPKEYDLVELYDLVNDPSEMRNIAKEHPELTSDLLLLLKADHPQILKKK